MRNLNKDEHCIVRKLVQARKNTAIHELSAGTILDESLDTIAIEWEDGKVVVLAEKEVNTLEQFMRLCDIISLFQYLEREGMIMVHHNSNLEEEKVLYNKKVYEKRMNQYFTKDNKEVDFLGKQLIQLGYMNKQHSFEMPSDLVFLLDKYKCAMIHPTQELVDYVENGFRTKEDIELRKQHCYTIIAIIISLLIGLKEELKLNEFCDWIWQLFERLF